MIPAQDLIVALVALVAALFVVRRVVGTFRPSPSSGPGCPGCANAPGCEAPAAPPDDPVQPLTFHRRA